MVKSKAIVVVQPSTPKSRRGNKTRQKRKNTSVVIVNEKSSSLRAAKTSVSRKNSTYPLYSYFEAGLLMPDVVGPIRVPRPGCSERTILGMRRTRLKITGDSTYTVQAFGLDNTYNPDDIGSIYASTDEATPFGSGTQVAAAIQFPPRTQVIDQNLVAGSITVEYIGNPLNVSGEIILTSWPDNGGDTSLINKIYTDFIYYPYSVRVPIASLINNPLRVSLTHVGPSSYDFRTYASGSVDIQFPVILCSGLPNTQQLVIEACTTHEIRAVPTVSGIPYVASGLGKSQDFSVWENTIDKIGRLGNTVSQYIPELAAPVVRAIRDQIGGYLSETVGHSLNFLGTRFQSDTQNEAFRHLILN